MFCETETKDYKYMKDNQTIFVGLKFRKKDVFDFERQFARTRQKLLESEELDESVMIQVELYLAAILNLSWAFDFD